ncbi:MAG: hypothetical protein AAGG08_19425, partial [Actinomycetota bacterium]
MVSGVPRGGATPTSTGAGLRTSVAGGIIGKAVEMVTLVALAVVVPRVLGADDYGPFAVALTVVTLGSLALTLGGHTMMARYVPAAPEPDRPAVARALAIRLARSRGALLLVLVASGAIGVLAAPGVFDPTITALVMVALVANVTTTLVLQAGLGLGRTGLWSARFPFQNAVLVVAAVVLHQVGGLTGSVVAIVVAGAVTAGLAIALLWSSVVSPADDHGADTVPSDAVELPDGALRFGALQAAGAALTQLTHRGGVLAVAVLVGSETETGSTALAVGIALGATYAILQLFTVALPHLSDGERDGEAVLRRLCGAALLVVVPATLVAGLTLGSMVPFVFGDDFADAAPAFGPGLGAIVLAPVASLFVQASALRLRPDAALTIGVVSAIAFVLVAVAAVPAWEAVGGVAATLVGVAAGVIAAHVLLPGAAGHRLVASSLAAAA